MPTRGRKRTVRGSASRDPKKTSVQSGRNNNIPQERKENRTSPRSKTYTGSKRTNERVYTRSTKRRLVQEGTSKDSNVDTTVDTRASPRTGEECGGEDDSENASDTLKTSTVNRRASPRTGEERGGEDNSDNASDTRQTISRRTSPTAGKECEDEHDIDKALDFPKASNGAGDSVMTGEQVSQGVDDGPGNDASSESSEHRVLRHGIRTPHPSQTK